jgi:hypothetical protein
MPQSLYFCAVRVEQRKNGLERTYHGTMNLTHTVKMARYCTA